MSPDQSPLVSLSWRTWSAGVLVVVAVALFAARTVMDLIPQDIPPVHTNYELAFSIEPPLGWDDRQDDPDGTVIQPLVQGALGSRSLVINNRLANGADPVSALHEITARPPAGPVRDLEWLRVEHVQLDSGGDAALGEFAQRVQSTPLHGWMVLTRDGSRMLQAVAVVPEAEVEELQFEVLKSIRTLRAL